MTHLSHEITGTLSALEQHSFSDEAAKLIHAQYPHLTIEYASNIGDVWKQVIENGSYGMMPFENSSGGVVLPHLDQLIGESTPLQIVASVSLQIRMCVGGNQGATLENAENVFSHSKGLDQCSRFLSNIQAKPQACSSTVQGVQLAKENTNPSIALASRSALEAYGLQILQDDVANLKGSQNVTKFFVIHRNGEVQLPTPESQYHAAMITPHNARGVLADILNEIREREVDLLSLHSRSIGPDAYTFYIEMQRQGSDKKMQNLANTLGKSAFVQSIKWLGSWDTHVTNETP